ncbi:MAG TPA: metallophosphoesterase [Planctomycetes bacterium]|nr:metallophosphoesterase [Planctomycetota bacterium]HIL37271.1 metallophosphoesterase [Planctomycetota bacterium]
MRYAILGDIHANETALCAVLEDIANVGADRILCLGDLVGYGGSPSATLQILRDVAAISIRGNHDEACCGLMEPIFFNPSARAAAIWTKSILTSNEKQWLAELPLTIDLDECSLAHGTYDHAQEFRYLNSVDSALGSLKSMPRPVCFVGHTHLPVVVVQTEHAPESPSHTLSARIELDNIRRAVVNPGSVGQPRDEDPRAAWGLYLPDEPSYELRRVEYDIEKEAHAIRAAGLPAFLADRLHLGI